MMSGSGLSLFSGRYRSSSSRLSPARAYSKSRWTLTPDGSGGTFDFGATGCCQGSIAGEPSNMRRTASRRGACRNLNDQNGADMESSWKDVSSDKYVNVLKGRLQAVAETSTDSHRLARA